MKKAYLSCRAYTIWPLVVSFADLYLQPSPAGLPSRSLHWPCFCQGQKANSNSPLVFISLAPTLSAASVDPVSLSWNILFSWFLWSYIFLVFYLPLMLLFLSLTACLPSIWLLQTEGPGTTGTTSGSHTELSMSSRCSHARYILISGSFHWLCL